MLDRPQRRGDTSTRAGLLLACAMIAVGPSDPEGAQAQLEGPAPNDMGAQGQVTQSCEVSAEQSVEIHDVDHGPAMATSWVTSDGERIYLIDSFAQTSVKVFDAESGVFVQEFGREGQGPGEFLMAAGLRMIGDSLLVLDAGNQRASLFGPDLDLLREWRLPVNPAPLQSITWVPSIDAFVVNGWSGTASAAGHPLHLLASDGTLQRSFGHDQSDPIMSPTEANGFRPALARSGTRMWSVRLTSYVLEEWDVQSGELVERVALDQPWLNDAWENGRQKYSRPPMLLGTSQTDDGLILVLGRENVEPRRQGVVHGAVGADLTDALDLRVDVFSPRSGTIVATLELPDYAGGFLDTGQLFTFRSSEVPGQMTVWDLELKCTSPPS